MKAEILTFSDGVPRVSATWTLREGVAACDVLMMQREAEEHGLAVGGPRLLYPRDGAAFLAALPIAYSGSYCRARLISDSTRGHRERGRLGDAETALPEAGRR